MKTISAIGIGLFLALSSSGADINITNIVLASGLSTSDTLLGVTNQSHTARATVQQVIDLVKHQVTGSNAANLSPWPYDIDAAHYSLLNANNLWASNFYDPSNLRYWGAQGTNGDDTIAIRNWLNTQTNLVAPLGIYGVSSPLEVTNRLALKMAEGARFRYIGATNIPYLMHVKGNGNSANYKVGLDGLFLDGGGDQSGPSSVLVINCLFLENVDYSALGKITVQNYSGNGIVMNNCSANTMSPQITSANDGGFNRTGSVGVRLENYSTDNSFIGSLIESCTNGWVIDRSFETFIIGGSTEDCSDSAIVCKNLSSLPILQGHHMEANGTNDVVMDFGYLGTFVGGYYQRGLKLDNSYGNTLIGPQMLSLNITTNSTVNTLIGVNASGVVDSAPDTVYINSANPMGGFTNLFPFLGVSRNLYAPIITSPTVTIGSNVFFLNTVSFGNSWAPLDSPVVQSGEVGLGQRKTIIARQTGAGAITARIQAVNTATNPLGVGFMFQTYAQNTGLTDAVMIADSGRVGLGTANPSYTLDVQGDAQANAFRGDGFHLTDLNTTNLTGKVQTGNLGYSGTPNSSTFLRGDNVWSSPSAGAATNVYETAAGTGININTNSLLYTVSVSPDVPLKSQVNTFSNNNEFQAGVQFDSTVTVNGNGFMGSKLNVGSTGSVDPTNQFEIHVPGGVLRYSTNGVLYVKLNIDGITITTNSQGQIQALNTNQNLLVTGTTNYVFSTTAALNFNVPVLGSLPATGLYRFTMCATECGSVDFDPAGNPEVFTMTYSDRLVDSPVTIPGQNLTLVRDGPPAHGRLDYTQVFQGLTNTAVSFNWSHSGFATVSSPITNIITYCLEKLY